MRSLLPVLLALVAIATSACGGNESGGGSVTADGSSTVGPFVTAAAEAFRDENDANVTVGISGTGGGFERFCRGETDLSNASRAIEDDEAAICEENGVEYLELRVTNDALTVVVNKQNDWARCLTVGELEAIWKPGSKVSSWQDVRPEYPDEPLRLFGPGTDSGTFDYFTSEINGKEGASRTDYSASEDDNVIVQGVAGSRGGLGYLGFSYYEQNQETLRALEIDGGSGCVAPSVASAQAGEYTPLSRPLYVYVKTAALEKPAVEEFVRYMLDNAQAIAETAQFVPLNETQLEETRRKLEDASA